MMIDVLAMEDGMGGPAGIAFITKLKVTISAGLLLY